MRCPRAVATAAVSLFISSTSVLLLEGCGSGGGRSQAAAALADRGSPSELRPPEFFTRIEDREERSRALFLEATKVMLHPRCVNCHPAGDSPRQGDTGLLHDPPVVRGPENEGIAGLMCTSCHQDRNLDHARVPGAPSWHLAPKEMAWVGRTPHELCEQLKDTSRNGGKTTDEIVEHTAHDELVAWGWSPGWGRTPAPGTQARFGALMSAWKKDGAACPRGESRR